VLWIRISFKADPDSDRDPGRQTNLDPYESGSGTWPIFKVTISLKGWKPGLFVNFGQFPFSWIRIQDTQLMRIRIPIRIHNTVTNYGTVRYPTVCTPGTVCTKVIYKLTSVCTRYSETRISSSRLQITK
jgi:hypothetical protein